MTLVTLKTLSPKQLFKIAIPIKSSIFHLTNVFGSTQLYAPVLLFFFSFGVSKNKNGIRMTNLMYAVKPYYYVYTKLF